LTSLMFRVFLVWSSNVEAGERVTKLSLCDAVRF